jgi:hypothetical protein
MQQGGYGMQPGYGQQPGFGQQQGGYGQQPGMQPYGAPAAAKSGKTGLVIGIVVFMVLAVGTLLAVFLRSR